MEAHHKTSTRITDQPHAGEDGHAPRLPNRSDAQCAFAVHLRHSSTEGNGAEVSHAAGADVLGGLAGTAGMPGRALASRRPRSNCAVLLQNTCVAEASAAASGSAPSPTE